MTKRITRAALLTALALILFAAEAQIPPLVPIPGVKLGLANVVTVWAMFSLGPADTLAILLARILLGSVFAGSVSAAIFSLSGGFLCYLAMLLLRRILTERQMWVCSVFAAVCHNAGQLLAAILVYRTRGLALYFPVLMFSGIVTGLFTGLTAQLVARRLGRKG